jgi:hypothetical protein
LLSSDACHVTHRIFLWSSASAQNNRTALLRLWCCTYES